MKKGIHPNYRPVVFQDAAANFSFLTRSCVETDETIKWTDGQEHPSGGGAASRRHGSPFPNTTT